MKNKAHVFAEALDSNDLSTLAKNNFMENEVAVFGNHKDSFFQLFDDGSFLSYKKRTFMVYSPASVFDFLVDSEADLISSSKIVRVIHPSNFDKGET